MALRSANAVSTNSPTTRRSQRIASGTSAGPSNGRQSQEVEVTGVTTETTKTMHGVARAYEQTVKVKKKKNNGQSSQDILESSDADMDCQFRLDMEAAMRESEQLAVLQELEYANKINLLNEQLNRLRPGGQSLCGEDVGVQYRQGDCMFQAIRMQYLERSQQLPSVLK